MLAPVVLGAGVVHPPVRLRERVLALDERVAELVEDHLREAVVRIERVVRRDRERAGTVGRGVRVARPLHAQPDPARRAEPHLGERVDVAMGDVASHAVV